MRDYYGPKYATRGRRAANLGIKYLLQGREDKACRHESAQCRT
jgi:3-deoxy-D-manno-octulosonate 8-phosphate phosphatase KdsC-like HAD superfamily phosphatase